MAIQLVISTKDKEVRSRLVGMAYNARHLGPVFRNFGEHMERSISKNFREGGRPSKWQKSKRVELSGGKTLIKTRYLQNSINYRPDDRSLAIGTNVIYARIHQLGFIASNIEKATVKEHWRRQNTAFGKPISARAVKVKTHKRRVVFNMPARPFLLFQDDDIEYIKFLIGRYLTGEVSESHHRPD